ncbi:MAG: ABC transporter ATP-binding protein [Solirubrobacterales bacterium]
MDAEHATVTGTGTEARPREGGPRDMTDRPVALEVRGVGKTFHIPEHRIDSFKERAVHPLAKPEYRELEALRDVSFDVHQGEFVGIVGRNGSGKSTLLKILASIYRADAGRIRVAGRMAPFIELGVGFNPELSGQDNVVLNAVMMGLTPREARRRVDAVFEFAELDEFRELSLKNYSSGMSVRLAFSTMLQADADVMLIDEVLAVGDASFQQKCADVFHDMRDAGKTVVLVTHDMMSVQAYCDRAMLLHDGELLAIGDPEEVGRNYIRLNFSGDAGSTATDLAEGRAGVPDLNARLVSATLLDGDGNASTNVEEGEAIRFRARIEARRTLTKPVFAIHCMDERGTQVFSLHRMIEPDVPGSEEIAVGEEVEINAVVANPLTPGRYFLRCWVTSTRDVEGVAVGFFDLLDFVVFGVNRELGVVYVDADMLVVPIDVAEDDDE